MLDIAIPYHKSIDMRTPKTFLLGLFLLFLYGCTSGPSEADLQAEREADQLDSATQVIETVTQELQENAAALNSALDSLDVYFPEEE